MFATCVKTLLAAGAVILAATAALAQSPVELRFAVQTPPQIHYNKELFTPWAEKVSAESNGTIKVTMFFAGTLGKEGQLVDVVQNGAADIALDIPAYYPGRFPLTDAASLPLLIADGESGSKALWAAYEKGLFGNEFDGIKVLAVSTPPAATILTTKATVSAPADMKGLKIAAGGQIKGAMVEAVGAAPVNVKVAELYQSLDRGVVDGAMTYYTAIPPFKLNEVAKHYLDVPLGGSFMLVFMSQKRFDALPDDAKKAIDANSGAAMSAAFGKVWDGAQKNGRNMATGSGGQIHTPNDAQMAEWKAAFQPILDNWGKSVAGGSELVSAIQASLSGASN